MPSGSFRGHDRDRGIAVDHERRVDELAVHTACERGLGQAGADARGEIRHRDRVVEAALAAVGSVITGIGVGPVK